VGSDAELVLPEAAPGLYLAWAASWLASDGGDPGDVERSGNDLGARAWTDPFMTRFAIPSIQEQTIEAMKAGAGSVSPRLQAEPEFFARVLPRLANAHLALASEDEITLDQVRTLHDRILGDWGALAAALPSEQQANQESVFHSGYDAFQQGDLGAMQRWFAPEATLTVPGHTPYSGTYRGLTEILALLTLASDRLGIDSPVLVSSAPDGEALLATFDTVVHRGNRSLAVRFRQRLWFNDEGQIVRSVLTFEDEEELNAFFGVV
jgi:uncharacterized protein